MIKKLRKIKNPGLFSNYTWENTLADFDRYAVNPVAQGGTMVRPSDSRWQMFCFSRPGKMWQSGAVAGMVFELEGSA